MNVAQAGDEIRVAAGAYTGTMFDPTFSAGATATVVISTNIAALLGGYSPDFASRNAALYETTLSASSSPGAFVMLITGTNTLVDGFTLTGATGAFAGDGSSTVYFGGAIRIRGGAPTISNNKIQSNFGSARGGGIYVGGGASPNIVGNLIYSNTTDGNGGGIYIQSTTAVISGNTVLSNVAAVEGGGIFIDWNVPATIFNNVIGYNHVISSTAGRGSGVRTIGDAEIVIVNHNEIFSNTTNYDTVGGLDIGSPAVLDGNYVHHNQSDGILVADSALPVTLTNNVVVLNARSGIVAINFGDVRIVNNTVAQNTLLGIDLFAWPITPTIPITATILNNIVANNGDCGINGFNGVNLTIDYNDVYNNALTYCGLASPPSGSNNISANPLFVGSDTEDYRLNANSPAIDAGTSIDAPAYDRDGVARPQGSGIDMGAYEFAHRLFLPLIRR
jgi:hypothetical protein